MRATYYRHINSNPHFRMREDFLSLIKYGITEDEDCKYSEPLKLGGIEYTVSFSPLLMRLELAWTEDGEQFSRDIYVKREQSNLPSCRESSVYYLLCPLTGRKCRKIYRIGSYFCSRKAFRHVYPQQMESRLYRDISYRDEPFKRYGKEYYKGKLTPYGKRVSKYLEYEERWIEKAEALSERMVNKKSKKLWL